MMTDDPVHAAMAVRVLVERSRRILVLTHHNPDGDAMGSLLGMWHALRGQGKGVFAIVCREVPRFCRWLPGCEQVISYLPATPLPEADLICLVDCADLKRIGPIYDEHASTLHARTLLIIDHHHTNSGEGTVNLVSPASASCAELVYRLLQAMEVPITADMATCLLFGIYSDTQSFQVSTTNPLALRAAADLLEAGGDHAAMVREMFFATPLSTIRLMGLTLGRVRQEGELVWLSIPLELFEQAGAELDAYDQVLSLLQRIAGGKVFVLFKERAAREIKVSLRAVPPIDVAAVSRLWNGGGHKQAAGATLLMPLEQAEREVLTAIRQLLSAQTVGERIPQYS